MAKAKPSRKIKHIMREERTISQSVLANMLEPYMLACMHECRDMLLLFLSPAPVRTANHGERVDKKGWAFNDIGSLGKRMNLLTNSSNPYNKSYSDEKVYESEDSLIGSSILPILKYLSSSRLDILILLEVTLLETSIGTIASRYNVSTDYVKNHLKGCLAYIAMSVGSCNVPAALPYIRSAEAMRLKNTPKLRRVRAYVGKVLSS